MGPLVIIVLIATLSSFVAWAFSGLRRARTDVRATWNDVEAAIGARAEVVSKLVSAVTPKLTPTVADKLEKSHARMSHVVGPRGADAADRTLRAQLDPILTSLPSSMGLDGLKAQVISANQLLDDAASTYNEKVAAYETLRNSSKVKVFAETLGFEKESKFADKPVIAELAFA
jgi:hypothetical protein